MEPFTWALIIGGIASAVSGIAGAISADSASERATNMQQKALDKVDKLAEEQKSIINQQLAEWKTMFGDVQTSVVNYFKNLTPDKRETLGFQNLEKHYADATRRLSANFAQRGLSNSGARVQSETALAQMLAEGKARVSASATEGVAREKAGFLQLGLHQKNALNATLLGINQKQIDQQMAMFGHYGDRANQADLAKGQIIGDSIGMFGDFAKTGLMLSALQDNGGKLGGSRQTLDMSKGKIDFSLPVG